MKESKALPSGNDTDIGNLISIKEASKKIGLGKDWFYNHMRKGTLPFRWYLVSEGKRVVNSGDIKKWLKLLEVPAGSMPGNKKEDV